jgi:hypothetical protein
MVSTTKRMSSDGAIRWFISFGRLSDVVFVGSIITTNNTSSVFSGVAFSSELIIKSLGNVSSISTTDISSFFKPLYGGWYLDGPLA